MKNKCERCGSRTKTSQGTDESDRKKQLCFSCMGELVKIDLNRKCKCGCSRIYHGLRTVKGRIKEFCQFCECKGFEDRDEKLELNWNEEEERWVMSY